MRIEVQGGGAADPTADDRELNVSSFTRFQKEFLGKRVLQQDA